MTTREEVAMQTDYLDALDELTAAKDAYRSSSTDATRARLNAAKVAIGEQRAYWRGIREFFRPAVEPGDGVAAPDPIKATSRVAKAG